MLDPLFGPFFPISLFPFSVNHTNSPFSLWNASAICTQSLDRLSHRERQMIITQRRTEWNERTDTTGEHRKKGKPDRSPWHGSQGRSAMRKNGEQAEIYRVLMRGREERELRICWGRRKYSLRKERRSSDPSRKSKVNNQWSHAAVALFSCYVRKEKENRTELEVHEVFCSREEHKDPWWSRVRN